MQIDALAPGLVGDMYRDFGNRYCDPTPSAFHEGNDYKGATHMEELNAILKARLAPSKASLRYTTVPYIYP